MVSLVEQGEAGSEQLRFVCSRTLIGWAELYLSADQGESLGAPASQHESGRAR